MCLQLLLAREEEVKRRNAVTATKYVGPVVRYHSKCVSKDTEQASSCDEGPDFEMILPRIRQATTAGHAEVPMADDDHLIVDLERGLGSSHAPGDIKL